MIEVPQGDVRVARRVVVVVMGVGIVVIVSRGTGIIARRLLAGLQRSGCRTVTGRLLLLLLSRG